MEKKKKQGVRTQKPAKPELPQPVGDLKKPAPTTAEVRRRRQALEEEIMGLYPGPIGTDTIRAVNSATEMLINKGMQESAGDLLEAFERLPSDKPNVKVSRISNSCTELTRLAKIAPRDIPLLVKGEIVKLKRK